MVNMYLHPLEWHRTVRDGAGWRVPGGDALGILALQNDTQKASTVVGGGHCIAFYESPRRDMLLDLGTDIEAQTNLVQRSGLRTALGLSRDISATKLSDVFYEILREHNDPSGTDHWRGLRGSRRTGVKLLLPGFGQVVTEAFDASHPSWTNTREIYRADYRRLRPLVDLGQVSLDSLRRMTGDMMRRLGVDDPALILPPEYVEDRSLVSGTLIGDTFVEASNLALTSHIPTGTGGFSAWTKLDGIAFTVIAATDNVQVDDTGHARADFDQSSDGHYSQVNFQHGPGDVGSGGPAIRIQNTDGSTITLYRAFARRFDQGAILERVSAGVATTLQSETLTTRNGVFYFEIDEADAYTFKDDGVVVWGPTTDGSPITANVRAGFRQRDDDGEGTIDNFESNTLVAAPTSLLAPRRTHRSLVARF